MTDLIDRLFEAFEKSSYAEYVRQQRIRKEKWKRERRMKKDGKEEDKKEHKEQEEFKEEYEEKPEEESSKPLKGPYEILGITKNANMHEVKSAYHKLVRKYHPDANNGNRAYESKLSEIINAYQDIISKK